jgi:hypothetical protein
MKPTPERTQQMQQQGQTRPVATAAPAAAKK